MSDINITGSDNIVFVTNVVTGDKIEFTITGENNVVVINTDIASSESLPAQNEIKPSFWHHPLTKTVLYVIGAVVAAALIFFFGFK